MAAISGVGSSNAYVPQRPSPAQLADNLFSKLDPNGQGYIDKDTLQTALTQGATGSGGGKGAPSADEIFSSFDGNNDGKLTKQEFTDGVQKLSQQLDAQFNQSRVQRGGRGEPPSPEAIFSAIDTKNQGFIDKAELQSAFQSTAPNGAASTEELSKQADELFAKLDGDQDGKVSKQEFGDALAKVGGPEGGRGAGGPQGAGGPGGAGGPQGAGGAQATTSSSSSDSDYDPADSNKDGTVSAQELAAYQISQAQKQADAQGTASSGSQDNSQDKNASILRTLFQLARTYGQQDGANAQNSLSTTA